MRPLAPAPHFGDNSNPSDETRASANINDQIGGKDPDWAQRRTAEGTPTLLVTVDPNRGLTRADIDQVLAWLPGAEHGAITITPPGDQPHGSRQVRGCPCQCNHGGFCGGCGHRGCGGRRLR